jgi:hypothetical protein
MLVLFAGPQVWIKYLGDDILAYKWLNIFEKFGLAHRGTGPATPRDGSGSGLERISADFRYVGCGFGSDFRPRATGSRIWLSATLCVWGEFYISPTDIR